MKIILGHGHHGFFFETSTLMPNEISRGRSQKISTHKRVGQSDVLQWLGPGKDVINMRGEIFPEAGFGSADALNALHDLASLGEAQRMIMLGEDNIGYIVGKFMISDIAETGSFYNKKAKAQKISFSCKLTRQG